MKTLDDTARGQTSTRDRSATCTLAIHERFDPDRLRLYARLDHAGLARVAGAHRLGACGAELRVEVCEHDGAPDPARLLGALALLHHVGLDYSGELAPDCVVGSELLPSAALLRPSEVRTAVPLGAVCRVAREVHTAEGGAPADVYAVARALEEVLPPRLAEAMTHPECGKRPAADAALAIYLAELGDPPARTVPGYRFSGHVIERSQIGAWLRRALRGEKVSGRLWSEPGSGWQALIAELLLEAEMTGFEVVQGAPEVGASSAAREREAGFWGGAPRLPLHIVARTREGDDPARGELFIQWAHEGSTDRPAGPPELVRIRRTCRETLVASAYIPGLPDVVRSRILETAVAEADGLVGVFRESINEQLENPGRPFTQAARERFLSLSHTARRLLETAAIARAPLRCDELAEAALVAPVAVEELLQAGLVRRDGDRLRLVHPKLEPVVTASMSASRIQRTTRRLAERLGRSGSQSELSARLWLRASLPGRALPAALDLARKALARGQEETQVQVAELLRETEEALGRNAPGELLRLEAQLARALGRRREVARLETRATPSAARRVRAGELARFWLEAGQVAEALKLAAAARAEGAAPDPTLAVVEAEARLEAGEVREARALLEASFAQLGPGSEPEADGLTLLGVMDGRAGLRKKALACLRQGLEAYRTLGAVSKGVRAMRCIAALEARDGRFHVAIRTYLEALETLGSRWDRPDEGACHLGIGAAFLESGQTGRARLHLERACAIDSSIGEVHALRRGCAGLARLELLLGRARSAESTLRACLDADRNRGARLDAALVERDLSRALIARGALREARERLGRVARILQALEDEVELAEVHELRALIALRTGRSAAAERVAAAALRCLAQVKGSWLKRRLQAVHARALLASAGVGAAEPLVRRLARDGELDDASRLRLEALCAAERGEGGRGRALYVEALELLESSEDAGARFEAYLEYSVRFGGEMPGEQRACVRARLTRLGRELGRESEISNLGPETPPPPRGTEELGRDGLVALAHAAGEGWSGERILAALAGSLTFARAALVVEGDDGPRVVHAHPEGSCPAALELAAEALLLGRSVACASSLAAPGDGLAIWLERPDRAFAPEERAFVAALARFVGVPSLPQAESVARVPTSPCIVGRSPVLLAALERVAQVAPYPISVFIGGESGTGKELAAHTIHALSGRVGELVAINCAAIPDTLFESELFGHVRGAFSGAEGERAGLFERADGGTLFLDEVAELPAVCQAKLLRALEKGEVRRVGDDRPRSVDVRVLSATNTDLDAAVGAGRFRADLLYRLRRAAVFLPPLRERDGDLVLLIRHFAQRLAAELGVPELRLSRRALSRLRTYRWPGNVRELEGLVCSLAVQSAGRVADLDDLPQALRDKSPAEDSLRAARAHAEREVIIKALRRTGGNRTDAASILEISRHTLLKLIGKLGLAGQV